MEQENRKKQSWLERKRPVEEGLIEDILGPASQIDELISRNPLPEGVKISEERNLERPK